MKKSTAMKRFVDNAERIRTERGLSIQALADSIAMDRGQLSRILSGTNSPTLETMERIAKGLKCDVIDFLAEKESLVGVA
jgi:transcriptional regulator with XRE-family HTH domain